MNASSPSSLARIPLSWRALANERQRRATEKDRERVASHADAIRSKCRSLYAFIEEFWPILEPTRPFVGGWAIRAICAHLEAVTRGDIQYLLINVPPGMMKSLAVAVFWPAWEWGPMGAASTRYLTSSFSESNVIRDNLKMRRLIESEKFRALYPEVKLARDQNAKTKFENTATGNREGRAFASMTGGRGDRVIIDDPHSVDSAESDTVRGDVVTTFREAIPDRLNDMQKSAIVVIMQRLHADDVAGTILKLNLPYVHLNLPMEFETFRMVGGVKVDARCRTYVKGELFFEDPRQREGELLFPERFPRAEVEGLKTVKGSYAYAGQYQQRPTAREGGLFKRAWFAGKIIAPDAAPIMYRRVRAWDFAASELLPGTSPDWSAGLRMARDGVDYYIEGVDRMQETAGTVQRSVIARAETDPPATIVRLPQDPGQAGKAQAANYVTALSGYTVKVELPSGSKVVRAEPLAIQAEFGHVYLVNSRPIEEGVDSWIETFLDELCAFPTAANDDQVDAAADAFNELALGSGQRFESASTGTREVLRQTERDGRYRYGDDSEYEGAGWGSIPSSNAGFR